MTEADLKAQIEKRAKKYIAEEYYGFVHREAQHEAFIGGANLLAPVVLRLMEAMEFYSGGKHFEYCGLNEFEPETASGEPINWLCGGNDDSAFQYEDGFIAREVLADARKLLGGGE